jgi:signal transduction histidine kinase
MNGGTIGSVPLFLIGVVMLSSFILDDNKAYLTFISVLITAFCSLFALDIFVPGWLLRYPDLAVQTLDMGLATLFLLILCSLSLAIFRTRYEKERRALERSVDYKSRFLAQMSHEVRTPLNAILGFSKLLKKDPSEQFLNSEQHLYLQRIHDNGLSLLAFFDDLLDISKIEEGQLRLHLQKEINLSELLEQCVSHYQFSIRDKALAFQQHFALAEPCLLYTDPQRLKQMVGNLLSNAIKFTPPQGHVELNTFQDKNLLCIEVQDSGPGIKKSEQELVFTPFYRDNSQAAGSGLGLAIIKELCDLMGYQLRLKSDEGQGSCFQIWIPL